MKWLCCKSENNVRELSRYSYCAYSDGSSELGATDLANLGERLAAYAEHDGDPKGFVIYGTIEKLAPEDMRRLHSHRSNPKGLSREILEELSLIITNKTESHRRVLVE